MEEIDQIRFWEELKKFCQLHSFEPQSMLRKTGMNTRRSSKNAWKIRPFDEVRKANAIIFKLLGLLWPHHLFTQKRKETERKLKENLIGYYKKRYSIEIIRSRESQIVLTDQLRQQINDHYFLMNKDLSKLLNRDLSRYKYY